MFMPWNMCGALHCVALRNRVVLMETMRYHNCLSTGCLLRYNNVDRLTKLLSHLFQF